MPTTKPFNPFKCIPPRAEFDPSKVDPRFDPYHQARHWRDQRIELLSGHGEVAERLALRLSSCDDSAPCLSGACPVCLRNFRIWYAGEGARFISDQGWQVGNGYSATLILPRTDIIPGQLSIVTLKNAKEALRLELERSVLKGQPVIGGWDFSYNSQNRKRWSPFWQPHVYVLMPTLTIPGKKALKKQFRNWLPYNEKNPLPQRYKRLWSLARPMTYSAKTFFNRRVNDTRPGGRSRIFTYPGLRPAQERELLIFLDQLGMTGRLIMFNVHRRGCQLEYEPGRLERLS